MIEHLADMSHDDASIACRNDRRHDDHAFWCIAYHSITEEMEGDNGQIPGIMAKFLGDTEEF